MLEVLGVAWSPAYISAPIFAVSSGSELVAAILAILIKNRSLEIQRPVNAITYIT